MGQSYFQAASVTQRILRQAKHALAAMLILSTFTQLLNTAVAATRTTSLQVSATVSSGCVFSNVNTLAFGNYDPQSNKNNPLDMSSTFSLTCPTNTYVTVKMDTGSNAAHANGTTRALKSLNGAHYLSYDIYTNASRTAVWNTTTNTVSYTAANNSATTLNVYGRIPQNQNPKSGSYSDTVIITATY